MRAFLVVLYVMLGVVPASAADSVELIERCRLYTVSDRDLPTTGRATFNLGYCAGYLLGYLETHGSLVKDRSVCFPDQPSVAEVTRIYIAWADQNPALWHLPKNATVNRAFRSAFPCRRQ